MNGLNWCQDSNLSHSANGPSLFFQEPSIILCSMMLNVPQCPQCWWVTTFGMLDNDNFFSSC
jgi:hypothetical protein